MISEHIKFRKAYKNIIIIIYLRQTWVLHILTLKTSIFLSDSFLFFLHPCFVNDINFLVKYQNLFPFFSCVIYKTHLIRFFRSVFLRFHVWQHFPFNQIRLNWLWEEQVISSCQQTFCSYSKKFVFNRRLYGWYSVVVCKRTYWNEDEWEKEEKLKASLQKSIILD